MGVESAHPRDVIIKGLLDACYKMLSEKGMTGMFLDGVAYNEQLLVSLRKCQRKH